MHSRRDHLQKTNWPWDSSGCGNWTSVEKISFDVNSEMIHVGEEEWHCDMRSYR